MSIIKKNIHGFFIVPLILASLVSRAMVGKYICWLEVYSDVNLHNQVPLRVLLLPFSFLITITLTLRMKWKQLRENYMFADEIIILATAAFGITAVPGAALLSLAA
ncbi:MAG: hypothetical protein OEZ01_17005 [Candidatus Heimdallarchaeota archaeon]|nr:hypothetical protein [Candidatus Heimdallarchaeota archaeon]MDH5647714.1 hypothetical protein [Candidatus Heimdallarchaeota archaeon]